MSDVLLATSATSSTANPTWQINIIGHVIELGDPITDVLTGDWGLLLVFYPAVGAPREIGFSASWAAATSSGSAADSSSPYSEGINYGPTVIPNLVTATDSTFQIEWDLIDTNNWTLVCQGSPAGAIIGDANASGPTGIAWGHGHFELYETGSGIVVPSSGAVITLTEGSAEFWTDFVRSFEVPV